MDIEQSVVENLRKSVNDNGVNSQKENEGVNENTMRPINGSYRGKQNNKNNKSDNYKSWTFAFSDTDKDCIKKYHDKKYPVLISFLCKEQNLYYSEIVICTYNEFINVSYKKGITIGKEKNKK